MQDEKCDTHTLDIIAYLNWSYRWPQFTYHFENTFSCLDQMDRSNRNVRLKANFMMKFVCTNIHTN